MNKKTSIALYVLLFAGLAGIYFLELTTKRELVYVDSNKLLNEYEGMKVARGEFEKKAKVWQANIDTLTSEVQQAIKDFEKESPKMTEKERALSKELIKSKQDKLVNYQKAIRDQSQQEDYRATQEVLADVNAYLKEFGEKHSYAIILAATDAGNIVYAQDGLDITEEVIEGLNKRYVGE